MMEGEVVFYDQSDLDDWKPRPRALLQELIDTDTTSPLGQLFAEWNSANKRSIDEYARRRIVREGLSEVLEAK